MKPYVMFIMFAARWKKTFFVYYVCDYFQVYLPSEFLILYSS